MGCLSKACTASFILVVLNIKKAKFTSNKDLNEWDDC